MRKKRIKLAIWIDELTYNELLPLADFMKMPIEKFAEEMLCQRVVPLMRLHIWLLTAQDRQELRDAFIAYEKEHPENLDDN